MFCSGMIDNADATGRTDATERVPPVLDATGRVPPVLDATERVPPVLGVGGSRSVATLELI